MQVLTQVIAEGDYERRTRFCNWLLREVHDGVYELTLTVITDETWFHLSGYISAQNKRYWSSINLRQTFEVPLHD
jgi:hypothetical protein